MITKVSDLKTWQLAHKLTVKVYGIANRLPEYEKYGLVSQIRRSSASIPHNIAEGFARKSIREKLQFYSIARGSISELEAQLLLIRDLKFIDENEYLEVSDLLVNSYKLLNGFIRSTRLRR